MCCVGRKKVTGKKSQNIFSTFIIPRKVTVRIIIFALFLFLTFCFVFSLFVCFLFCFCFDIYSRPWLRTNFDWCLIDMYSIPTPSNYKGIIIIETLIYENQNLTRWYSPIQLFLIRTKFPKKSNELAFTFY
jgi:hypothetical protein